MSKLKADDFLNHPKVEKAKKLIDEALVEVLGKISEPSLPIGSCVDSYKEELDKIGKLRGSNLMYPYISSGIGNGPLVELRDGSIKYDFISGIGVHHQGHSNRDIIQAALSGALEDTIMQGNLQQSFHTTPLLDKIIKAATINDAPTKNCFLTSSGAMANENALKMIFQKKTPANRVLAFSGAFAGRTLALSQVTDKAAYRSGLPRTLDVDYLPFYDELRPEESLQRAMKKLEILLERYPQEYGCMIFELIQGEGGYYGGNRDFFIALIERLKKENIAILFDEIQTFGRTDCFFAYQHFGLDEYADIVTFGKTTQVCGTLYSDKYKPKPGLISQTFTSSSVAITAAQKIFDLMNNGAYLGKEGKIASLSVYFRQKLQELSKENPLLIQGPFGYGAMFAFTFKDGTLDDTKIFMYELYEAGLIGFIAGRSPYRIRFLPPMLSLTKKHIDGAITILKICLQKYKES